MLRSDRLADVLSRTVATRSAVIQRRVPEYDTLSLLIAGTSAGARSQEKKLKKIIRIAVADMRGRGDIATHQTDLARLRFEQRQARGTRVTWDRMLDPAPLAEKEKLLFKDLLDELRLTAEDIERYGRYETPQPTAQFVYPGASVRIGPPEEGSDGAQRLTQLVDRAASTMENIAAGDHDDLLHSVFPTRHADAKQLFGRAAAALRGLHKQRRVVIDTRRDQEAVHAGGLTNPSQMALAAKSIAQVSDENVAVLIHESTHAIDKPTTDGIYIDLTPNSPFLRVAEDVRLGRAPYYEEVGRRVLGLRTPPFPPWDGAGGAAAQALAGRASHPDALAAQQRVEQLVTEAWTVAINAHGDLLRRARVQRESLVRPFSTGGDLGELSDILGLTMHKRPAGWREPEISDMDLAIAESRATHLARFLTKAKWTLAQRAELKDDARHGERHDIAALEDDVLTELVTALGQTRKSVGREKAFIRLLASAYDKNDRVGALAKTTDRGAGW